MAVVKQSSDGTTEEGGSFPEKLPENRWLGGGRRRGTDDRRGETNKRRRDSRNYIVYKSVRHSNGVVNNIINTSVGNLLSKSKNANRIIR